MCRLPNQICSSIVEVYAPESCHISVTLDLDAIDKLKLGIDAHSIRERILKGAPGGTRPSILRSLTEKHVLLHHSKPNKIRIRPPDAKERGSTDLMKTYFIMQALKTCLPDIIVQGISTVSRAVISSSVRDCHLLLFLFLFFLSSLFFSRCVFFWLYRVRARTRSLVCSWKE